MMLSAVSVLLLVLSEGGFIGAENWGNEANRIEKYRFLAVPIGKERDKEDIEVVLSFHDNRIELVSTSISQKAEEKIRVKTTPEGHLISGDRTFTTHKKRTEARIWRDEDKVYVQEITGGDKQTKILTIPEGNTLAIEASLFVLLRFFPYASSGKMELFVIDFEGRSVTATAHKTGVERIVLPAGEFHCYRMAVDFHVIFPSPEVVCWVTTETPHIAVKSYGKRGIFTPKYLTTLIGELPMSGSGEIVGRLQENG